MNELLVISRIKMIKNENINDAGGGLVYLGITMGIILLGMVVMGMFLR